MLELECSLLEIQKLAWFLQRMVEREGVVNPLNLNFQADRYGPYSDRLRHLLNNLDGSYLHCERRLSEARPLDPIWFENSRRDKVAEYLASEDVQPFRAALEATTVLIDGFESPLGMELLATVDWLLTERCVAPDLQAIKIAVSDWPGGKGAGERKARIFDDRMLDLALRRLGESPLAAAGVGGGQ